ncbi:MAG: hypothetical protein WC588_02975 [Candidatus Micrarchaeia archaeon]
MRRQGCRAAVCMLIYFYDLRTKLKDYNRIKRNFYYDLKKNRLSTYPWKTKSVIVVEDKAEGLADRFFMKHKRHIEVYKARATSIEEVF